MLQVERFVNQLMNSNCYIIYDNESNHCLVIDPGSEQCIEEIAFFEKKNLIPEYVILTHEHTDHTWGCNTLFEKYGAKIVCNKICGERLNKESNAYFLFYYDNPDYSYKIEHVDVFVEDIDFHLQWQSNKISFIYTPGHSIGSMCILINNMLFTGDTLMKYKVPIDKRNCSIDLYNDSLCALYKKLFNEYNIIVFPGHGNSFFLRELENKFKKLNALLVK